MVGKLLWMAVCLLDSANLLRSGGRPRVESVTCWVHCHCDNRAVVVIINCQSALLCHYLHCLFFTCARFDFNTVVVHTPGVVNMAADALSRNNLPVFSTQVSKASLQPSPIPPELCLGLSVSHLSWMLQD